MSVNKKDVIRLLEEIATYLELKGENQFRISAYRKAAQNLERDVRSLQEIDDFTTIPGIGKGTNEIIVEFIEKGESTTLQQLKEEVPAGLVPLLKIPGLGGKRLATLYKELNIVDAESLKEACESGAVEKVRGFGKKTVEKIKQALESASSRPERLPIAYMLTVKEKIENYLQNVTGIIRFDCAGSLRRLSETVRDIDFIIATNRSDEVRKQLLDMPHIKDVIANGETKVSLMIEDEYDVNVDFRLVEESAYFTMLHHFTGSKEHNVRMRQIAKSRGEKISEYGVLNEETGELKQFESEEAFFQHFNLPYISPELREDDGEIERAEEINSLVTQDMLRGDVHVHTTWSDGAHSIEEMVEEARTYGYEYIAITDHSKYLRVANGLNETRLRKQREEIERLNEKYDDIHIFSGVEMDILPDGSLDFSDDFLQEMDLVIAAIHSSFNQSETEIMKRLTQALENPYVDIIAHPTGRLIGRRDHYAVDVEQLIEKAHETGTVLELNANPNRFDLKPYWLERAKEANVPIAINTDAHRKDMFAHIAYGVQVARKAWLRPEHIMNCWSLKEMQEFLKRNK